MTVENPHTTEPLQHASVSVVSQAELLSRSADMQLEVRNSQIEIPVGPLWDAVQAQPGVMSEKTVIVTLGNGFNCNQQPLVTKPDSVIWLADNTVIIDEAAREVIASGMPLEFTKLEFDLFAFLGRNADQVMTHPQIIQHVWGDEAYKYNSVHVTALVKKVRLALGPEQGDVDTGVVRTIRSLGYKALSSLNGSVR